ncbi:MAG: F0F1 ATP synthase subunit epsilon [Clostridiales Family XIII bacterium]|jgi:F-type H+-transporting ATPase subunit epsilon|nr:F0F1 ATP synthase subunit epsilon [Clostridiales Family XIII bacterium]
MAKSFSLEIVTPEKLFYWGDVEIVIAKTLSGEEGFMAGHVWACKLLGTGELWFREAGAKDYRLAAVSGGFIDVRTGVLVFTDSAEWPDEIDVERANISCKREEEWLERHGPENETPEEAEEHRLAIRRAENRRKVAAGGGRARK